ncbi:MULTISPECIES: flavodoxin FldA [unclassified Campylobacter]|uniref:flavodoxin FldA n=1 Tax=unclassified Campylobacter TaxID=2593542 RepID=UPI001238010E|nr:MULTISPECIES: flavodoxin FldA [unclassified Campylobacter]KAA6227650.1 flavodoxin FldA [Campylobacter sp. LR185c]KAA6228854.1 flavodoxin FldA [Campylobacter sp. LR286c]KAA6229035.1 flavodoxin FldA [Campylobacter sp. LR196d]KAA6233900.1 flavodoxin FldA [Campylobacter sp. LR291e]KAA6234003.1 flavodoxin FldA [Campylobacter sp. LR264d]
MSIAVVYGSAMGNTEGAANLIAEKLGVSDVLNIASVNADKLNSYDSLICGTSTWGSGDLQDDWDAFDFGSLSLSGKKVAVFGMGDSQGYSDTYCGGMGKLATNLKNAGAQLVGAVSVEGYDFESSEAVVDGSFVGLALDNDNQEDLTESRIDAWVSQIKNQLS